MWDLIEDFNAFNISLVPRTQNKYADKLASIGVQFDPVEDIKREKVQAHVKLVIWPSILDNDVNWQVFDSDE